MKWFNSDSLLGLFALAITGPIIGVLTYTVVSGEMDAVHDWNWWLNDPLAHRITGLAVIAPATVIWVWVKRRRSAGKPETDD